VLQSLNSAGIEVEDIALRQPNLDEVFLAFTGKRIENDKQPAASAA
jgi:hypothetical protein